MIIHNFLGPFSESLRKWEKSPTLHEFTDGYYRHFAPLMDGSFFVDDAAEFHSAIADLDWLPYRTQALSLDPLREENRLRKHIQDVEKIFGFKLEGEVVLFGAFEMMDGYARFDRGTHRVFLGVDESHARGNYLDILMTHELTHVARESRPEVWEGWGLDPKMSHDDFGEFQPVIEHVFGEGFSCAVSELLVPGEAPWEYAYQTEESLAQMLKLGAAVDKRIAEEIRKPHAQSNYARLYDSRQYSPRVPSFAQYVWGWQWAKKLLRERAGGDPRKLVSVCSKDFVESALSFRLRALSAPFK